MVAMHDSHRQRVEQLVRRGQAEGAFRDDLPTAWLVSLLEHVLHGAASDVADGRLLEKDAARLISESVLGAYGARPDIEHPGTSDPWRP